MHYRTLNEFFDYHPKAQIVMWRSENGRWHIRLSDGKAQLLVSNETPLSAYDTLMLSLGKGDWHVQNA